MQRTNKRPLMIDIHLTEEEAEKLAEEIDFVFKSVPTKGIDLGILYDLSRLLEEGT